VIILTRLGGSQVAVNPDLIERAEPTPDTVITMVDGHKLVVAESVGQLVDAVREWRASVASEAYSLTHVSTDDVVTHSALDSSLARVLRMPLADRDTEA
jgi:flagellar protein FlbD